ncbi:MAG TPA: sensor histidine kinase KdpD [Nitrolancea sp.]|nr:sensor histidine kinase KdpD [Nitrolancea sp.]
MDERERIDDQRPTAEQMLARVRRDEPRRRGRLRVFLGAAPGVGKTYAMLEEGHRLRDEGHDVVIGFVETYRRRETEEQIGDLEVLPRRTITYRGVSLDELDTDAVLARHPEIVLIDELAHTNAPGSPREKRYQDVELLLDAGITVLSTMNIQHLEGLNDLIEGVTGIKVRETVPDRVLDEADVELIDLSPALLRERLAAGKIYPEPQAIRALEHFFRESNLTALRELALQRTAEGVEAALEDYMRGEQVPGPWPTIERVLACFNARVDAETVLRRAWRLARGLHADLLAVSVIDRPLDALPENQRDQLLRTMRLAEDLGAEVLTVVDTDPARGVLRVAAKHNVTDIVLGRPEPPRRRLRRAIPDLLVDRLDRVDIHIVAIGRDT